MTKKNPKSQETEEKENPVKKAEKIVEKLRTYRQQNMAKFIPIYKNEKLRAGFATFKTKNGNIIFVFMVRTEDRDIIINARDFAYILETIYSMSIQDKEIMHHILDLLSKPKRKFEIEDDITEEDIYR